MAKAKPAPEPGKRGRKPKAFSPEKQAAIIAALSEGRTTREVAAMFGEPESTIRSRFSDISARTISVASQIVSANCAVNTLPIPAQGVAISLAQKMQAITSNLADAALASSVVSAKAAMAAQRQAEKLDPDADELDLDLMTNMAGAARIAREAADLPTRLMQISAATKVAEDANTPAAAPSFVVNFVNPKPRTPGDERN